MEDATAVGGRFLAQVKRLIHVGANSGQERDLYAAHGVEVLWIEALPETFAKLIDNIRGVPRQRAIRALVTDKDGADYVFHVANNEGESSSILDLAQHRDIWPAVLFERDVALRSTTLDTLLGDDLRHDALVMDTQGSELLVLQGARRLLRHVKFVKTEAADFESYVGCAKVDDITSFLARHGFALIGKDKFAERAAGGTYFELLFEKRSRRDMARDPHRLAER